MLYKRRSIRSYSDRPVEKEIVELLIEAALLSPSSRSLRPWEFIAVDDPSLLTELAGSKEHGSQFLSRAPLAFVVLGMPDISDVWIEDCSIATLLIQIEAETRGLGSCWIQIRNRMHNTTVSAEDFIKMVLDIPGDRAVESIIALGYPKERKTPYTRDDLLFDKIFFNGYSKA